MVSSCVLLLSSACGMAGGRGAVGVTVPRITTRQLRMAIPPYVQGERLAELAEPATLVMLEKIESAPLTLPSSLASGPVSATFVKTNVSTNADGEAPPLVVLHGFDSSCLEFRRLMPELEQRGVEAYALDVLGWGFADTSNANTVSVEAKREYLHSFWKEVLGGRPMALAGVSLGAAVIIDFHAAYPEAVASAALIDPQGFIDGAPPVPEAFARAGIQVLGSWPLRSVANQLAYCDTNTYATDDAIRVGLLHCARPGWEDDSVDWLLGGGYSVSQLVPRLSRINTLIMWGRQDEILPPQVRLLPCLGSCTSDECVSSPRPPQPLRISFQSLWTRYQRPHSDGLRIVATLLILSNRQCSPPLLQPSCRESKLRAIPTSPR